MKRKLTSTGDDKERHTFASGLSIKRSFSEDGDCKCIQREGLVDSSVLEVSVPDTIEAELTDKVLDSKSDSDYDSLFDEDDLTIATAKANQFPACRLRPDIPGLFFDLSISIPARLADDLWSQCMQMFFHNPNVNQVMLFERARSALVTNMPVAALDEDKGQSSDVDRTFTAISPRNSVASGIPPFLTDLLVVLEDLLKGHLPPEKHALLFPRSENQTQARQVILNHYRPGEGITPHVDLLGRYGDGIIGVSLHSGCVMRFAKVIPDGTPVSQSVPGSSTTATEHAKLKLGQGYESKSLERYEGSSADDRISEQLGSSKNECAVNDTDAFRKSPDTNVDIHYLYLPARSVLVLCEDSRYIWTHGIEKLTEDLIESKVGGPPELIPRKERLSITFRWLLPGADVVGDAED